MGEPISWLGNAGGKGEAGGCGIRSTIGIGERREGGSYKEASEEERALIEDGKL